MHFYVLISWPPQSVHMWQVPLCTLTVIGPEINVTFYVCVCYCLCLMYCIILMMCVITCMFVYVCAYVVGIKAPESLCYSVHMWQVPLCTLTVIGPEINTEIDANIHSTH
jgi:hypothetical protein